MTQATTLAEKLTLVIDLDERGSFRAHVENEHGATVFSFSNEDEETGWPCSDGLWLVDMGFMKHGRDGDGLLEYLQSISIASPTASLKVEG